MCQSARALAKKKGLDVSTVPGTGNFGRVTEADVLAALGEAPKKTSKASSGDGAGGDVGPSREAPVLPDGPKVKQGHSFNHCGVRLFCLQWLAHKAAACLRATWVLLPK